MGWRRKLAWRGLGSGSSPPSMLKLDTGTPSCQKQSSKHGRIQVRCSHFPSNVYSLYSYRNEEAFFANIRTVPRSSEAQSNPRGIPVAPFVDDVEKFVDSRADIEPNLKKFQEMIAFAPFTCPSVLGRAC